MKIKSVKLKSIELEWQNLYRSNFGLSPYASFEFAKIFSKYYRFAWKRMFLMPRIYQLLDEADNTRMIIPLFGRNNHYYIFGDLLASGYMDFIYPGTILEEEFEEAFKLLQTELEGSTLHFNRVNERSRLNDYLKARYSYTSKDTCVDISFGSDYEEYFGQISARTRRNLHNRHNRLSRDSIQWVLDVITDKPIPNQTKNAMLDVYNQRFLNRDGVKVGKLLELSRRYTHPITIATTKMKGNFNSILRLDGSIAAFLCGYSTNDDYSIVVPRLAINDEFADYSPGLILISETVRWLIQNSNIRRLDLAKGDERYKFGMGGKEHYNYAYKIDL